MPKNDVTQYQLKFDGLDNFQLFAVSELTWPIDPYKQNGVQLVFWNEGKRKDFFFQRRAACVLILNVRDDSFSKDLAKMDVVAYFGFFSLLLFFSKIFHDKSFTFVENVSSENIARNQIRFYEIPILLFYILGSTPLILYELEKIMK